MKKRIAALLIAATFIVSALTACGSNPDSKTTSDTPSANTLADQSEEKKPLTLPYTGDAVEYEFMSPMEWQVGNNTETWFYEKFQEKIGNITFKYLLVPDAEYEQKKKIKLAADDMPDIVNGVHYSDIISYWKGDIFLDFENYAYNMPDLQGNIEKYPQLDFLTLNDNGQKKRFNLYDIKTSDLPQVGWMYNKNMLDKYNVPVPKTLEEMIEASRTIRKESGDKVYPLLIRDGLSTFCEALSFIFPRAYDGFYFDFQGDKKWSSAFLSDAGKSDMKNLMLTANTFYKESLIHPEFDTMSQETANAMLEDGQWAFFFHWCDVPANLWFNAGNAPKATILPMPTPALDASTPGYQKVSAADSTGIPLAVSSKVKNPEVLTAYFNYMYTEEYSELVGWGEKGLTYTEDANGVKSFTADVKTLSTPNSTAKDINKDWGIGKMGMIGSWDAFLIGNNHISTVNFNKGWSDSLVNGSVKPWFFPDFPAMSTEDSEYVSNIRWPLNTFYLEQRAKFIFGDRDFAEFDQYIEEGNKMFDIAGMIEMLNKQPPNKMIEERVFTQLPEIDQKVLEDTIYYKGE